MLGVLGCLLIPAIGCGARRDSNAENSSERRVLTTNGVGEVIAYPDKAALQFAISAKASTSAEATKKTAQLYANIASRLKEFGYESHDPVTKYFRTTQNVAMDRETRQPYVTGFLTDHCIQIETADVSQIGEILDVVLEAGATKIVGVRFSFSKKHHLHEVALAIAVETVHKDAEIMAKVAGGSLGRLMDMDSNSSYGRLQNYAQDSVAQNASAAPTTLVPDSLAVKVGVSARWEYLPAEDRRR